MPAKSKQQQKFMGMVHALNKGDIKPSDVSKSVKDVAKTIKKSDAEDFASTKHSGLPKKVKEQILKALKEYANKMAGNKLGGSGSYGYAPQKGLRDDDGYEDNEGPKDEGFASDAQRRAAFASGYKAKGKKGKKESVNEKISRGQLMSFNKLVDKGENVVVHGKNGKRYIYQNSGDLKSVGVTDDIRSNPEKTYQVLPLNKIKKITIESVNENEQYVAYAYKGNKVAKTVRDSKYNDKLFSKFKKDMERKGFKVNIDLLKNRKVVRQVYRTNESLNEGMFSTLDQIRKDSKNVRDFVKNVFKDRDFMKMKNDKEFIKYLKSIYEGVDESKGVPQNYMQGRTSDYHTALRGRNRDYSGGTNFKKTNHGQPDIENAEEDEEVGLKNKQTPAVKPKELQEAIGGMSNKAIEDEMKKHGIKKIPIDSHGLRLLKGLQKEKFINKVDNLYKLTYFYATIPKGKRYSYGSAKKPLSPLFDYFQNELMGQNIILTSKMAAYRVAQNIIDMYNNNEEIDSPYYLLKNYFNSFGMDTNRSRTFKGAQYHLDQWLKRNKKYEKAMMKESINEVKVETERYFGKKGIIIMIRDGNKLISAIFKDKKNADKFNRNNPSDVKKLYQLAKKTKFPKTIDEYGQRLDLSFIDDKEARLKGTPEPKDAIDRDIEEYSGGSYEYTKGDQYGQNSVNEIGVFPIQNYVKGIIPSNFIDSTTRQKKERLKSTLRDLKNTLNHFWKQHKIPYRIK